MCVRMLAGLKLKEKGRESVCLGNREKTVCVCVCVCECVFRLVCVCVCLRCVCVYR